MGSALVVGLASSGWRVRAASRRQRAIAGVETSPFGALHGDSDFRAALHGVETVVHLAGPAHARFSREHLRAAIVDGTGALAQQAREAGVKRMIYVSSIKAAAEQSRAPLKEDDAATPGSAYGAAKREAELKVLEAGFGSAVVLRPPLVFAHSAVANFAALIRLAASPLPLPFAGISNQRSLLSLPSFVEAIASILATPQGQSGVFHLADQPALSTPEIVAALRKGLDRRPGLFPAPGPDFLAPRQLTESLVVDDSAFRRAYTYGARADVDCRDALAACARDWKAQR